MQPGTPEFGQMKSSMKASWMAGDFGQIADFNQKGADEFVGRLPIQAGMRVLDVACGTGNTSIPAAQAGGKVTGIDIAPNLLEQARKRASAENLRVEFREGDSEDLPVGDQEFDIVLSMFGVMFAPRPDAVAAELTRVCKPGGLIAMANWTPEGFVGKSFQVTAKWVPLPPGMPPPILWGNEQVVRDRLGKGVCKLDMTRQKTLFDYPFGPRKVVEFFLEYFGPMKMSYARLDKDDQERLASSLESLWAEHNTASNGGTRIEAEYLDVRGIRA